ncbi:MAG: T9SS type A sorting domain-containing protein [Bacteroidota bacterium]
MKNTFLLSLILLLATTFTEAQVRFDLRYLPDKETYMVSLLPMESIPTPLNAATNVQVVLKVPLETAFVIGHLESQIAGIDWVDNAYQNQFVPRDGYTLCAIAMTQQSTHKLVLEEGVALPLFTFQNIEGGCAGTISLPDNKDIEVKTALARGANFTQNISLLATRGNAFSGVSNSVADCGAFSTSITEQPIVADLKAYPIPTAKYLNIEWTNITSYTDLQLDIINTTGQLVKNQALDASQGPKSIQLLVDDWAPGMYKFRLRNEEGSLQQYQFIIIN